MTFDRDTAISLPAEDCLGRAALATRLADVIADGDRSRLVVGIHGASGSGKTSLLQLVGSALRSRTNVVSVRFNPWMLEASPGPLLPAFFATMRRAFRFEDRSELRRLDKLFQDYGAMCSVSFPRGMTSRSMGVGRHRPDETLSGNTVDHLGRQIDEALQEAGLRLVVFIDDVDRLARVEMRAIFRLVNLLSNVRGMTFVLACDPVGVNATLDRRFRRDARPDAALLEKVVQLPIVLPFTDDDALRRLTLTAVNNVCLGAGVTLTAEETERFGQRFEDALLRLVRTPRRARRYANALALTLPLFKREDGCIVEHLCREGLRVLQPDADRLLDACRSSGART